MKMRSLPPTRARSIALPAITLALSSILVAAPPAKPGEAKSDHSLISTLPVETRDDSGRDHFPGAVTLAVRENAEDAVTVKRERLVRVERYKYPLVLVQEVIRGGVVVRQEALAGDHLVLKKTAGREDVEIEARIRELGGAVRRKLPVTGVWLVSFANAGLDTVREKAAVLSADRGLVQYAEPDPIGWPSALPNDPRMGELFGMHNTGQNGGTVDADVDAPEAWDIHTGSPSVLVGVVDTGFDYTHPDLAANAYINTGEATGQAGVDDDNNGYIDDVRGWDFAEDDNEPDDFYTHGTHCSGTLGAVGNNGEGVAGVCWQVKIIGAKWIADSGFGSASDAAEAVAYCTRMGVALTSNSWHIGSTPSQPLLDAINAADAAGVLFVCAGGNDAVDADVVVDHPRAWARPNMITVAALDRLGARSYFSAWGLTKVHLGAPGSDILSTLPGGLYGLKSGTSMACPHVAGACALVKSFKPSLSHTRIREIILQSAVPNAAMAGRTVTGGQLNVPAALLLAGEMSVSPSAPVAITGRAGGPFAPASWTWTVTNYDNRAISWTSQGAPDWITYSPTSGTLAPGASTVINGSTSAAAGTFPLGTFDGGVTFRNITSGLSQRREVPLTVESFAPLPFSEGFEGPLQPYWKISGTGSARTRTSLTGPHSGTRHLTMDAVEDGGYGRNELTLSTDLAGYDNVVLNFWLYSYNDDAHGPPATPFQGGADFDGVAISDDGIHWYEVQPLRNLSTGWRKFTVNLDDALSQLDISYSPAFRIRFNHYDDLPISSDGFGLDDIELTGTPSRRMAIALPSSAAEGGGAVQGTIILSMARQQAVTVNLTSSDPAQISVPASVTIPAGQTSATFPIVALDDALLDGSRPVSISTTASVTGGAAFVSTSGTILAEDNESAALTVTLPASVTESASFLAGQGTVSVPQPVDAPVSVRLTSSRPGDLRVPPTVTIPVGASSVTFDLDITGNDDIDGGRTALVTASVTNWTAGQGALLITDDEDTQLRMRLRVPLVNEHDGTLTNAAEVSLSGKFPTAVIVNLVSAASTSLTAPDSVTIPAGQTTALISLTAVDDALAESLSAVQLTANATGFLEGTLTVPFHDDDAVPAAFNPRPPHMSQNNPLETDLAWDSGGDDRVVNGGFERGDLSGWKLTGPGTAFMMNDGTVEPPGPEPGIPPLVGTRSLALLGEGAMTLEIAQDILLPPDGPAPELRWTHRIRNLAADFSATHDFKVTVLDLTTPGALPVDLFSTAPGQPLLQSWTPQTADLHTFRGRMVRISFRLRSAAGASLHTHLDGISVPTAADGSVTWDVKVGTSADLSAVQAQNVASPALTLAELAPGTRYYWQVTSHRGGVSVTGPVWEFLVPSVGPLASFTFDAVNGPQLVGVPFPVTVRARDSFGNPVPFPGTVLLGLTAASGVRLTPVVSTEFDPLKWTGSVTLSGTPGMPVLTANDGSGHSGSSSAIPLQAGGALAITLGISSAREGDGTLPGAGVVTVSTPSALPLSVRLTSVSGREIAPQTIVIPAGDTAAIFGLTIVDDTQLDGTQSAALRAEAPGYASADSAPLPVYDNESAVISLSAPATVRESDGDLVGIGRVSVPSAPAMDVTIALSSSDTTEIKLPAAVLLRAGETSASFDISVQQDTLADRSQLCALRATVNGWTQATAFVTVQDDESTALTFTVADKVREGAALPTTVALGGVAPFDTPVTLTSSDTTEIQTPASVTVLAGKSNAAFSPVVVDDVLTDGSQTVTLTGAAPFFLNATASIEVQDNDPHHFAFATIPDHQADRVPIAVTLSARDSADAPLDSFFGTITLTASGPGGALAVEPATITNIPGGTWAGTVSVAGQGSGIRITATAASISGQSNVFTLDPAPLITTNPASLTVSTGEGLKVTRPLTIGNLGGSPLHWNLTVGNSGGSELSLPELLTTLNTKFAGITALIPNRFAFSDGVTGNYINDGGNDMYDSGNYISTSLGSSINYSDNTIVTSTAMGTGGRYFTRKFDGLWVFAADVNGITSFDISGNLGADGDGTAEGAVITRTYGSATYKGFFKRVFGSSDPSVNHLIIVKDNGAVNHTFATNTDDDQHGIQNLTGITRIYTLLFASASGGLVTDAQAGAIMDAFLKEILAAPWLTFAPQSGTTGTGDSSAPVISFDALGLSPATYTATLRVNNDDYRTPVVSIPVSFTVRPGVRSFTWDALGATQLVNQGISATIRSRDPSLQIVPEFTGSVDLTLLTPNPDKISGTGTVSRPAPINTGGHDARATVLLLKSEVGPAGRIRQIGINVLTVPGITLTNFTIRLKHTTQTLLSNSSGYWDNADWTTVYRANETISTTSWRDFTLQTPFDYNGTDNLMFDFSFNNTSKPSTPGAAAATTIGTGQTRVLIATSDSNDGDPLSWTYSPFPATSTSPPNIRIRADVISSVTPASTGAFTAGIWSDDIYLTKSGTGMRLSATDADGHSGLSNAFNVTSSGTLSLTMPASVAETAGTIAGAGTVTLPAAAVAPVIVVLKSSDPALTVPTTVTIPAGATSAAIPATLLDNVSVDGSRSVQVSAIAPSYLGASATVLVTDNEQPVLTLTAPASMQEGGAAQLATLTLNPAATRNLTFILSTSTTQLSAPLTLVVPAGSGSISFNLTAPDNNELHGRQDVILSAVHGTWPAATRIISVNDNDPASLTFTAGPATIIEGASGSYTLTLSGQSATALTVNLTSSHPARIANRQVIIAAGLSSLTFPVAAENDTSLNGDAAVTLTASLAGFTSGTRSVTVLDNEAHHFNISTVSSPQIRRKAFPVTITARNAADQILTVFTGPVNLTAQNTGGAVPLSATTATLTAGTANFTLSAQAFAAGVTLRAAVDSATGSSNAFDVTWGSLAALRWDALPASITAGVLFPVRISAEDAIGNPIENFSGPVALTAEKLGSGTVFQTVGTGTGSLVVPVFSSFADHRAQAILTPADLGGGTILSGIGLEVLTAPPVPLSNYTIRVKHTTATSFQPPLQWDNAAWTTVFNGTLTLTPGWNQMPFTAPFLFNGTDHLMIDFSFDNAAASTAGSVRSWTAPAPRLQYGSATNTAGAPLSWTGANPMSGATPSLPILRFSVRESIPGAALVPASSGAFTAGIWNGNLTYPSAEPQLRLAAVSGSVTGKSPFFGIDADTSNDDSDADGLANWLEEALGANPAVADSGKHPAITLLPGGPAFIYHRRIPNAGYTWQLEQSAVLASWSAWTPASQQTAPDPGGLTETVTIPLPLTGAGPFYRLRVTRTP